LLLRVFKAFLTEDLTYLIFNNKHILVENMNLKKYRKFMILNLRKLLDNVLDIGAENEKKYQKKIRLFKSLKSIFLTKLIKKVYFVRSG
jgi:hypothetical protein